MRRRKVIPVLVAIALIILAASVMAAVSLIKKYTPTKERADLNEYFSLTEDDEAAVIIGNELLEAKGMVVGEEIYIDYDTVKTYLNARFYWDSNENLLLYTTPDDVIRADLGSRDYYVTKEKISENYDVFKMDGGKAYVAIDFVQKYTNLEYKYLPDPNRIQITSEWGGVTYADVRKDGNVRLRGGIKSEILTEAVKGDSVFVIERGEKWAKVRTADGYIGYIENKRLTADKTKETSREFEEPVYTGISKDHKINLVWHQVTNQAANNSMLTLVAGTKGINTISPTWFSISDNEGNISNLASANYVNHAHQIGIEVWGLVDNFKEGVSTLDVLSYTSKRERLTNQLIAAAIEYNLDGINVDFEQLSVETGEPFIQFIRELSIKCRKNGIVLSVDNYVPEAYSNHYNRTEQGIVADYVIIMGYDEHFAGSEESGSVASLEFVKRGIENTLKEVPKEKVINAVPFYTRLWKEVSEGDTVKITSEALGMKEAETRLSANGVTPVWDDAAGQYYAEYEKDGAVYKVWLEEEKSIEEKMKLVSEYELAGVGAWKLGLEKSTIWDVIIKYVN